MEFADLIKKYNVPGPRYTSYPTVPYWENNITPKDWKSHVKDAFNKYNSSEGLSIYIHLPYCESLCTYCGCNTRITVNHKVERPYLDAVLKEWNMYCALFGDTVNIKEIHLGGGTPTFFSAENLSELITGFYKNGKLLPNAELSFEAHPNNTTVEHLQALYNVGFRRLSLGIQDFNKDVQEMINRRQSYAEVLNVTQQARAIGYTSVNYDLIYGLPRQTKESLNDTIKKTVALNPDRIAFYSYAHVPWLKPGQRKYNEKDLPKDEEKRALYELGLVLLEQGGYHEVGMDHFAKSNDSLFVAMKNKKLHRNFMGYTSAYTSFILGLGVSSISDCGTAFYQNIKTVEKYLESLNKNELPLYKGHAQSYEDVFLRKHILELMCNGETEFRDDLYSLEIAETVTKRLKGMERDGLVKIDRYKISITEKGKPFTRNVCMALDFRLQRSAPQTKLFSNTV